MTDGLDYSYECDDTSTLPDAYDFASDARTARQRKVAWRILRANMELRTERDALRAELARVQAQLAELADAQTDVWPDDYCPIIPPIPSVPVTVRIVSTKQVQAVTLPPDYFDSFSDAWPDFSNVEDGEDVFLGTLGPPTGEE